jgi:hypothetical protein
MGETETRTAQARSLCAREVSPEDRAGFPNDREVWPLDREVSPTDQEVWLTDREVSPVDGKVTRRAADNSATRAFSRMCVCS